MSLFPWSALQARAAADPQAGPVSPMLSATIGTALFPVKTGTDGITGQSASTRGVEAPSFFTHRSMQLPSGDTLPAAATATTSSWSNLTLPTPRTRAVTLTDSYGDIWVIGGQVSSGYVTNIVEVYAFTGQFDQNDNPQYEWVCSQGDPDQSSSAPKCASYSLPPLPTGRTMMAGAWLPLKLPNGQQHDLLFLMGGVDTSNHIVSTVEVFDVQLLTWRFCSKGDPDPQSRCASSILPTLPTARYYAGGATGPDGKVYVIGGIAGTGISNVVEVYDPGSNTWSTGTPLQDASGKADPRYGMATATDANGISVLGGVNAGGYATQTNYLYNVYTQPQQWITRAQMPTPRAYLAAAVAGDGQLYAIGGLSGSTALTTVEAYNPNTGSWTCSLGDSYCLSTNDVLQPLPAGRLDLSAAASYGRVYAMGGLTNGPSGYVFATASSFFTPPPAAAPPVQSEQEQSYPSTFLPGAQGRLTQGARYDGHMANTIFGNYTYQHTDLQMPGFGPQVQITRTYSSLNPTKGIFGVGWSVSYGMHLTIGGPPSTVCPTANMVCVSRDDGRVDTYVNQNGAYVLNGMPPSLAGMFDALVKNADGSFTLTTHNDHLAYRFGVAGNLLSVSDADGNTVALSYTGGLWTGIRDASGRAWTLAYNSAGLVARVTDPALRTTQYAYDSSGNLISVTDARGFATSFTYYSSSHLLMKITDANGNLVVQNWYLPVGTSTYYRLFAQEDGRGGVRYFLAFALGQYGVTEDIDPVGAITYTIYDAQQHPRYRIGPLGQVTSYTYVSSGLYANSGLLASETDPNNFITGYATHYTYDLYGHGNIATVTDPFCDANPSCQPAPLTYCQNNPGACHTTQYAYDANNNLLSKTDALNHVTRYTYNSGNHPLTMTDALGRTTAYTYDVHGERISSTTPLGNKTTYAYDAYGNRTSVTEPLCNANPSCQPAPLTYCQNNPGNCHTTQYVYDSAGRVIRQIDPLGHTTQTAYNALNQPTSVTAADGGITTYTYDAVGNKLTTTDPLCNANPSCRPAPLSYCQNNPGACHTTQYAYDAANDLIKMTDARGYATSYAYDADGRQISRTLPDGGIWTTTYNLSGQKVAETSALCNANNACRPNPIQYCYSSWSATPISSLSLSDCHTTQYLYDADGNLILTLDSALGFRYHAYDLDDRLTYVKESYLNALQWLQQGAPASALYITHYAYDAVGNRTSVTDARGYVTTYTYDPLNRVVRVTNADGQASTTAYDFDGRVSSTINGKGETITYTYDADAHLVKKVGVGTTSITITYAYNSAGNRASMQDTQGTTTYAYDPVNRTTAVNSPSPRGSVTYSYDLAGNRHTMTQPGSIGTITLTYSYDADNHLTSVQSGGSTVVTYAYDSVGRNTKKTFGNGVTTALYYDIEGRLTKTVTSNAGGMILQQSAYALDNRGNRTVESATGLLTDYTYDALSRLIKAVYYKPVNGSYVLYHTYVYSYDAVGNRTNATVDGVSTNYTYDAANHMIMAGSTAVTYDAAGRITYDGHTQYRYDAFDHLTISAGSVVATYLYDGDDNRVGETVNGASSTFLLDTVAPLPQRIASTTSAGMTRYVYGLERAQDVAPNSSVSYEHVDGLGSVRMITNATGTATAYYWYTPTGASLAGSGTFGFTGEPYEAGGSLVYLRARDYSPSLDRFLTMDPHDPSPTDPITYNPYPYGSDNPVNVTDHSGQDFLSELWNLNTANPLGAFGGGGFGMDGFGGGGFGSGNVSDSFSIPSLTYFGNTVQNETAWTSTVPGSNQLLIFNGWNSLPTLSQQEQQQQAQDDEQTQKMMNLLAQATSSIGGVASNSTLLQDIGQTTNVTPSQWGGPSSSSAPITNATVMNGQAYNFGVGFYSPPSYSPF